MMRISVAVALYPLLVAVSSSAFGRRRDPRDPRPLPRFPDDPLVASTTTCPVGYCLLDGRCMKATLVEPEFRCPPGHQDMGTECVRFLNVVDEDCHRGNPGETCLAHGTECVCESRTASVATCPGDTVYDGEKCGRVMDGPASCPEGLAMHNGRCAVFLPLQATCERGMHLGDDGRFCERTDVERASFSCPDGSDREGLKCRTTVAMEPVCPPGDMDIGDRCVHFYAMEETCRDPNMNYVDGQCRRVVTAQMRSLCPNGGDPNDRCRLTLPGPTVATCSDGNLMDGMCIKTQEARAFAECPDGYNLNPDDNRECLKSVPYDCGDSEWSVQCEDPPVCDDVINTECVPMCRGRGDRFCLPACETNTVSGGGEFDFAGSGSGVGPTFDFRDVGASSGSGPFFHAAGGSEFHSSGSGHFSSSGHGAGGDAGFTSDGGSGTCIEVVGFGRNLREGGERRRAMRIRHASDGHTHGGSRVQSGSGSVLPVCHRVPMLNSKTCFQDVVAEATPFCREGTYKGDGMCYRRVQREPEMKCMGEVGKDGGCWMTETTEMVFGCPPGYTQSGGSCSAVETGSVQVACSDGHEEDGRCVSHHGKKCDTPDCLVEAVGDAIVNCPSGYVKRQTRARGESLFTCERTVFEPPIEGCPPEMEPEGKHMCIDYVQDVVNSSTTSVFPQFICPVGTHSTHGGGCMKQDRFPMGQQCAGGKFEGGACEVHCPKVRMCPQGSRDQHGHCFVISSTSSYSVDTIVAGGRGLGEL